MRPHDSIDIPAGELFDRVGSLVFVLNPDCDVVYANQTWYDVLGCEPSRELNLLRDLLHADHEAKVMEALQRHEDIPEITIKLRCADGHPVYLEGSIIAHKTDGVLAGHFCMFKDVSDHYERIRDLERAFELAGDMLGLVDFEGRFVTLNPAWQDVLGYEIDHMIGRYFIDFVLPEDRERTQAQAAKMVGDDGAPAINFENRYLCKDGSVRWLSWNATPLNENQRIYFVARDITERKRTEQQLDETVQQLRAILDNSGALIYMKDTDGRYILVNKEFEALVGRTADDIIGCTDEDLFEGEILDILTENEAKTLAAQHLMQFEERLPGEDGIYTYLTNKFPIHAPDGSVSAICSISTDITYRKITEMQLLLRNQAIEYSPTCISIADATLPDIPLIYINPAFERVTGYAALEVIGLNCRFLQGDDREQDGIKEIRAAIREQRSCSVTLRNYRKDGTMFYNELRLAPIHDETGRLTHYVGISTDVTERVQSADKIRAQNEALIAVNRALSLARKQAEDATRLKSQFLATMSHELRTPLNAIIGYTEIILAGMVGELNEEQHDYHERVLANADHLLQLINDILDLSKIEAGRMEIVNKSFHLGSWLDEVYATTRGMARDKGIEYQTDLDERLPEYVIGDGARIKQIAINLVTNAIKFTSEGYIKLSLRKHGREAMKLVVKDTGIGIPSHMQETIFEEFRQVDSSSSRKQGGTGLGLSIVRKLALMMGGNIRLRSQSGEGSEFTVILPLIEGVSGVDAMEE